MEGKKEVSGENGNKEIKEGRVRREGRKEGGKKGWEEGG